MRLILLIILPLCILGVAVGPVVTQEEAATGKAVVEAKEVKPDKQPARGSNRPDPANTRVSMCFEKADINGVIRFLSMSSGVPIVCDPELKGQVTIVSLKQIPLSDAYEVVNAALRVRGYAMVGTLDSKVIRVVTLKKAIADKVEVHSGKDVDKIAPGDNLVTQVIPLEYISATKVRDELKPLVADDQASIVAITATNTLIMTDNAGNIHRLVEIVKELDTDRSDVIEVRIHRCQHASADALVDTLNKIFQLKPAAAGQPQPGRQPEAPPGQPQPKVASDEGLISLKGEIRIASDTRTNSLIISASKDKIQMVLDVVKELDVTTEPEVKVRIFPLKYADAKMVADQLGRLFEQPQGGVEEGRRGGFFFDYYMASRGGAAPSTSGYAGLKRNVIIADVRTNSVIVTATEQNMAAFEKMINELDAPKVLSEITRDFPLKYAKAQDLADTLNRLFRGEYRRAGSFYEMIMFGMDTSRTEGTPLGELRNITVVAEEKTNTLLVTGPPQAFQMVEQLIERLDRRTAQVFIEVAIVDVTLDSDTKFGIEWTWTSSSKLADGSPKHTASTDFGLTEEKGGLKYSIVEGNVKALLHALESRSNVKVYSTTTITTADNVEAVLSIGRDEPFVSSETETLGGAFRRSVDFKNVAVALTVTPHVTGASDLVSLDVHQTINEIIGRESELNAPIVANREAKTSIMVKDGQTIVIGGIMKENRERVTKAVPIISRIPLVGELFKSREWRSQNSELMVFLTPHVLKDDMAAAAVTEQTREKLAYPPKPGIVEVAPEGAIKK